MTSSPTTYGELAVGDEVDGHEVIARAECHDYANVHLKVRRGDHDKTWCIARLTPISQTRRTKASQEEVQAAQRKAAMVLLTGNFDGYPAIPVRALGIA